MKTGVFKTSYKENEKRIPIFPEHIRNITTTNLTKLVFEKGYAEDYGYSDDDLRSWGCSLATREDLFLLCDILILPKPVIKDLEQIAF